MKNLSIPVSDASFELFSEIQKKHNFKNQSDTLTYIIEEVAKKEAIASG